MICAIIGKYVIIDKEPFYLNKKIKQAQKQSLIFTLINLTNQL